MTVKKIPAKQREEARRASKAVFIRRLAEYLVVDQARKSMELEAGNRWAKEWAMARSPVPLFGYPTVDEAEKTLTEFLK